MGMAAAIADFIADHGRPDAATPTPVSDVMLLCVTGAMLPFRKVYRPSLCVVAQGAKRIELNDRVIDYAAGSALIVGVEVPGNGGVTQASPGAPFLGMTIDIDVGLLRAVLDDMPEPPRPSAERLGVFVEQLSPQMQDCVVRLVRLLATPTAVPVLYPALMRELYFWLLSGPNGTEYCKIARADSHTRRIADAIYLMRQHVAGPLRTRDLAQAAGMGVSSFHQHFRALTAMSPLQYHKQLRLLEARRLMVAGAANVTHAAFQVGYESPSQFSRDYARMFGMAPKRDAMALKGMAEHL